MNTKHRIVLTYTVLAVIYVALALLIPPDARTLSRYQISSGAIRLLTLTLALPILGIWAMAFYGFYKYKEYADSIATTKDGRAIQRMFSEY